LCDKWDSNKRAPSRAPSTDRCDIHKKTRAAESDAESRTSQQELEEWEINDEQRQEDETMDPVFSGSSFFASPEPSMLPMPTFFRSRGPSMMPVPAMLRAH
jgi:amidophosphoribosyltransferase